MIKIHFKPKGQVFEGDEGTKLLVAARKAQVDIRYGCASCRCGTCGVRILSDREDLSPMKNEEKALLAKMSLPLDGSVRLSCQARALKGAVTVDLAFQLEYDPDQGD